MEAIVYLTNTGNAKSYAELISKEIGVPFYSLKEAKKRVPKGSEIIYVGWIMAGKVKGYKKANKRYDIVCLCPVGMAKSGLMTTEITCKNLVPDETVVFTLCGGFDLKKIKGFKHFLMSMMVKIVQKNVGSKVDKTPEEEEQLDMLVNGKNCVDISELKSMLEWYHSVYEKSGNEE